MIHTIWFKSLNMSRYLAENCVGNYLSYLHTHIDFKLFKDKIN